MRTIKVYRSYNFINKDPILGIMQTLVADSGESYKRIHELSDVSTSTLSNWFYGDVKRPQFATIAAICYALGARVRIIDSHGIEIKPEKTNRSFRLDRRLAPRPQVRRKRLRKLAALRKSAATKKSP